MASSLRSPPGTVTSSLAIRSATLASISPSLSSRRRSRVV
jgi:hypothetical protein